MNHRILNQLLEVNRDLPRLLGRETVLRVCREVGHRWRMRTLDPATTLLLFVRQVFQGNTACQHVSHLGDSSFTASAYCQARQRLPKAVFRGVLDAVTAAARSGEQGDGRWRGHRTYLVDGSSFSMPDSPALPGHFGQHPMQKAGSGFPIAHVLALVDLGTGLLLVALAAMAGPRDVPRGPGPPGDGRGRPAVGRPGVLLLCPPRPAAPAGPARRLPGPLDPARRLHAAPGPHQARASPGSVRRPYLQWLRRLGDEDQVVRWYRRPEVPA